MQGGIYPRPELLHGCYDGTPARKRAKSVAVSPRIPEGIASWCKKVSAEEAAGCLILLFIRTTGRSSEKSQTR